MSNRVLYYPERFKIASQFYTTGRPTYPSLLIRRVAAQFGLNGDGNVLDLGTGPGFLAIDFAPYAEAVTAVDPSQEMLLVAAENARAAKASINFVRGSSYDLGPQFGTFRLATIGRAFHWMDRAETLKLLNGLIAPQGGVALFSESYPDVPENRWHEEFQSLVDKYAVEDPARPLIKAAPKHEAVLLQSPFSHLERISVFERRRT